MMILQQRLEKYRLILASQSPRRQHLLKELGLQFETWVNGNTDESYPNHLSFDEIPLYLAHKKAKPFLDKITPNQILITSDTIVWCNDKIVGKPASRDEAIEILQLLSGKKHVVVTGVVVANSKISRSFTAHTDVYFRALTLDEIVYYIDTYKPFDKAGAYGVQEWIGYIGVERIEGSYFNVMGLPVQKLYLELLEFVDELEKLNNKISI